MKLSNSKKPRFLRCNGVVPTIKKNLKKKLKNLEKFKKFWRDKLWQPAATRIVAAAAGIEDMQKAKSSQRDSSSVQ